MDVSPATIEQVRLGRTGRVVTIGAAESTVAADLDRLGKQAGTRFLLRWHEETEHWSVIQRYGPRDDDEQLVATTTTKDKLPLLVTQVQRTVNGHYDLASELEKHDDRVQAEKDHAFAEKVGDRAERAFHTARRLAGDQSRIYIPGR